jgi:peroxiredoxin
VTIGSLLVVAVDKRVMLSLVGVAAVVSVAGGWAISRGDDSSTSSDDVVMTSAGEVQEPTGLTNHKVQGDPLPSVDLIAEGGSKISTSSLTGQPLVINVWYSDCAPCAKEMPDLAQVHREVGDAVRFVGIDTQDDEDQMVDFARSHGAGYELLRDPNGAFTTAVGIVNMPVTLLVTADGTIVQQTGVLTADKLRALIAQYLA